MQQQSFRDIVKNRIVIYVPIYSMFDKVTNKEDLHCDGNVNRFFTNLYHLQNDYKSVFLLAPPRRICKNFEWFYNSVNSIKNLNLIECEYINTNAGWQRSEEFGKMIFPIISLLVSNIHEKPLLIFEGQGLGLEFLNTDNVDLVYWCPVCSTETKTRSFLKNDKELNEKLFELVNTVIVATKEQVEYISNKLSDSQSLVLAEQFIDRDIPIFDYIIDHDSINKVRSLNKKVVYLPFRLSDEGYRIWDIFDSLNMKDILDNSISLLCPNVNGSTFQIVWDLYYKNSYELSKDEVQYLFNKMIKCSSDRNAYYSILDYCPNIIIPYFEDYNFIMHASVDEFVRRKIAGKVCFTPEDFKHELQYT